MTYDNYIRTEGSENKHSLIPFWPKFMVYQGLQIRRTSSDLWWRISLGYCQVQSWHWAWKARGVFLACTYMWVVFQNILQKGLDMKPSGFRVKYNEEALHKSFPGNSEGLKWLPLYFKVILVLFPAFRVIIDILYFRGGFFDQHVGSTRGVSPEL